MFSKQPTKTASGRPEPKLDSPAATPPESPATRKSPKVASLVAENMTIEGGVSGEGELPIDGVERGDIRVSKPTIAPARPANPPPAAGASRFARRKACPDGGGRRRAAAQTRFLEPPSGAPV